MKRIDDIPGAGTVIRFRYIIANGKRIVDLRLTVNLLIREGYEPIGGICFSDIDRCYCQAMVLFREE